MADQGKGPRGPARLIFRPNWGKKELNNFFYETPPRPLYQVHDDPPPLLSEGLDLPLIICLTEYIQKAV